jgi:predicted TPR repeat methyltransferase
MKMSPQKKEVFDRLLAFLAANHDNLGAIDQGASYLYQAGLPLDAAIAAYARFRERHPDNAVAAYNHAWYLGRDGQPDAAIDTYRRALQLGIDGAEEVHVNIGNIWMDHLLDADRARESFMAALAVNPTYVGAHHNLGNLEEQSGNREQAAAHFTKCLELEPGNTTALARLADTHRFREPGDPLLGRLKTRAAASDDCDLHFALGSAYNQLGEYDDAWWHFSRANSIDRTAMPPYSRDETEQAFDRIIEQSTRDWLRRFARPSASHVFICGMFRTGSTLLEQMLAAHPAFTAVGESDFFPNLVAKEFSDFPLGIVDVATEEAIAWGKRHQAYAERIAPGAGLLTDKRPDNFQYVGLIKAALPSAQLVVTERDWRDVALSIYTMRLGVGQNYATDLADIRHYIGQQERLVDHWAGLLGDDLMRLRYEDLVSQPRETLGRVLNSLGEEWDERCLAFDTLDNPVKTGSVWQVREPLHGRSIGRWKNYRPYFEAVFGAEVSS